MIEQIYAEQFNIEKWLNESFEILLEQNAKVILLQDEHILLKPEYCSPIMPLKNLAKSTWDISPKYYLGKYNHSPLYVVELKQEEEAAFSRIALKVYLESLSKSWRGHLCRAKQLLHWHKINAFCGSCGEKTLQSNAEIAKTCPKCKRIIYPSVHTAILVLIEKDDHILLARSPHFTAGVYSVLAGFIEAGETAEEAVIRETQEEVGILVKNIRYFDSQCWPFQNSFLLGFMAEYDSGDIKINPAEIEDANWYFVRDLPDLPYPSSLSRKIIDAFIHKFNK